VTASPIAVGYDFNAYPRFAVTVDIVLLTIVETELRICLIRRGPDTYPVEFRHQWALPGGFVRVDEDLRTAALRELAEETRINQPGHLEMFGAYGDPERDSRGRIVSIAYWAITPNLPTPKGGTDASHAEFVPVAELEGGRLRLAFDHDRIATDAINTARDSLKHTTIATRFCPPEFTIRDLREVYNAIWGTELEAGNFQRMVNPKNPKAKRKGFLIPVEGQSVPPRDKVGRPAQLFTAGTAKYLRPPLLIPEETTERAAAKKPPAKTDS
jgi:8-oxo-dGTP diphosphatase